VTCIVQSQFAKDTWYYSTGESLGNSVAATGAFYVGYGIYKSTDNGITWSRLTNSDTGSRESFDNCNDLISRVVVDPTNGNVYAASLGKIIRSTDGGATWGTAMGGSCGTSTDVTDLVCTTGGVFYAAFCGSFSSTYDGVWTSSTGASASWTRIASSATVTGWNAFGSYGRVVLALAPNNQNVLYALYYNNTTSACAGTAAPEADFFKYSAASGTWTDRSANLPNEAGCSDGNDPFACQGGYDLCIAVKPDDSTFVVIGGTNVYRSTDGFATTGNTTRIGGYASASVYNLYANSHPDIHVLVYKSGDNDTLWVGDDGGIQKGYVTSGTVAWTDMANSYRTYQYYYVAIDPTTSAGNYIGGAQDNGTTYNNSSGSGVMTRVYSGDGCSVGISSSNTYHYVSYQSGGIVRRTSGSAPDLGTSITPATGGQFVTNFYLDPDNTEYMYYGYAYFLLRTVNASTTTTAISAGNWTNMTACSTAVTTSGQINCFATTRGTYSAATASLFFGTYQGAGSKPKVFRLDDPANAAASTTPVDISPSSANWPTGGYVSGVAVNPRNDDTLLVVLSNYGVSSIWWTGNANSSTPTWQEIENNISVTSVRSCMIVGRTTGIEYYVGTHIGLYSTTSISAGTTSWSQEGSASGSLEYAIVTSMALRTADNNLLVGTHGNGMWLAVIANPLPVKLVSFRADLKEKDAVLEWKTALEKNNDHFDILRRFDDEHDFTKVGEVQGAGNSYNLKNVSLHRQ
jgi:hypothetical protein